MKNVVLKGKKLSHYFIDEQGNVFNREGKKLKQFQMDNGYMRVPLSVDGKNRLYYVHRLVAETFIENPHNFPIVHHKDGNRANNNVNNLMWCDNSFNQKERFKRRPDTVSRRKKVRQIKNGEIIQVFESLHEAERKTGIFSQNIWKVCTKRRRTAGGYEWEFV